MMKATFRIPAYVAAASVGSLTMGMLLGLPIGLFGIIFGAVMAVPAIPVVMLAMWPALMLWLYLANRFAWQTRSNYFWYSGASSVVTAGVFLVLRLFVGAIEPPSFLVLFVGTALLIFCGGLAGLAYRAVMLWDQNSGGLTLF
ncbi:hypothetical protein DevBK_11520 [Devosia sp. BK]|uniref:hypothetical protein n=1 Tax=Devosia sp. BK TaxID=2871706 RepID=UPI00293A30F4|nr:hypothetical protein [Devosia sp. BK]MDV3251962.1 hypothetical protein [Devosia sp. BK]